MNNNEIGYYGRRIFFRLFRKRIFLSILETYFEQIQKKNILQIQVYKVFGLNGKFYKENCKKWRLN